MSLAPFPWAAFGLVLSWLGVLTGAAEAQSSATPPSDLHAYPGTTMKRTLLDENGQSITVNISISTLDRKVFFRWIARGAPDADPAIVKTGESTSFFPTAYDHSRSIPHALYFTGKSLAGGVLERWTIELDYLLGTNLGGTKTVFEPPTINRGESLPIDSSLKHVSDITVNRYPVGGGQEEVWALDFDSGNVYAISPVDGSLSIAVAASLARKYRTIDMKRHTVYGNVCIFWANPHFVSHSARRPRTSSVSDATCDTDLNGTIDLTFSGITAIDWADHTSHPLYDGTGEFEVD